jgi:hypothetical protein
LLKLSEPEPLRLSACATLRKAAIGSNLYFDEIRQNGAWTSQKATATSGAGEETAYMYIGPTENGLLVVLAAYSGAAPATSSRCHGRDGTLRRNRPFVIRGATRSYCF